MGKAFLQIVAKIPRFAEQSIVETRSYDKAGKFSRPVHVPLDQKKQGIHYMVEVEVPFNDLLD